MLKNLSQRQFATPFYYYDTDLFEKTVQMAHSEAKSFGFHIHYALKANTNPTLLKLISKHF